MTVAASVARRYHEATKHSERTVRMARGVLDYTTRPHPFKEYPHDPEPVRRELDRLLKLGVGVVRTRTFPYGTYHFRTFSSAGGLYPLEVYLATADGLFHYHPLEHALRRLRGDVHTSSDAVLVITGIPWRAAWKYGERGYRHVWWDVGTLVANLLWLEPRARLVTAFEDETVDAVVGADGRREFSAALVALGGSELVLHEHELEPIEQHLPAFPGEQPLPESEALHAATRLTEADAVEARRVQVRVTESQAPPARLEEALRRRGSIREFAPEPVPRDELVALYADALAPIPSDAPRLTRIAAIANAVTDLGSGAYDFDEPDAFAHRGAASRALAQRLVLGQELARRAAAVAWLFADLDATLADRGDRGYREAQLEAGIRAGRLQVGAFARSWGATASTFFDDEVRDAFATTDEPMLCVAVGRRP